MNIPSLQIDILELLLDYDYYYSSDYTDGLDNFSFKWNFKLSLACNKYFPDSDTILNSTQTF